MGISPSGQWRQQRHFVSRLDRIRERCLSQVYGAEDHGWQAAPARKRAYPVEELGDVQAVDRSHLDRVGAEQLGIAGKEENPDRSSHEVGT
jgi:hypothetical protein